MKDEEGTIGFGSWVSVTSAMGSFLGEIRTKGSGMMSEHQEDRKVQAADRKMFLP